MVFVKEDVQKKSTDTLAKFIASSISSSKDSGKKGLMASPRGSLREEGIMASPRARYCHPESSVGLEEALIINPLNEENFDIDALDFVVGDSIYESAPLYRKIKKEELEEMVSHKKAKKTDLKDGEKFIFEPGKIYYVLSKETIKIPNSWELIIDSKSTIGRLGCICHDATDKSFLKKDIDNLIGVVRPYFFPIQVTIGKSKLFQGVFKYSNESHMTRDELLKTKEIKIEINGKRVSLEKYLDEDKLPLHLSTHKAYVSKKNLKNVEPINIESRELNWESYFEEVKGDGELILNSQRLYLLGTQEYLKFGGVCGRIGRESGNELTGLWSQFAGIIHAGFEGEITMECKSDCERIMRNGDLVGYTEIDKLSLENYDIPKAQGSYQGQKAPKLPKVFRED